MTIYFVRSQDFVKIGYSSNPSQRIQTLQTASPYSLDLLFFMPGSIATERELHSVFSQYHHLNEWYRFEGTLASFIGSVSEIFSGYTLQFEQNESYQDERDWEYWKARALQAEEKLVVKTPLEAPLDDILKPSVDWRQLTYEYKVKLARLPRESREALFPQKIRPRTRRNWHERLDELARSLSAPT